MHPFRTAVEASDLDAMIATLADDVTLHSPMAYKPFTGRESVAQVLGAIFATLTDFTYVGEAEGGGLHCLRFRAKVGGEEEVEGVDLITEDAAGKIADLTVMMRPASGLMAVAKQMAPKVEGAAKA